MQTIDYDDVMRSKIIVGTPAMVVDRLGQLKEELGLTGILAELNCGMRIPHRQVVNSLNLMCRKCGKSSNSPRSPCDRGQMPAATPGPERAYLA